MVLDEIKKKERREGREEGKIEGLEEGIEIGKENIVVQLLQKTHDVKHVSELLDMPIEAIDKIAQNNNIHL